MTIEEVRLLVPADPAFLELAVDTAATLAARCAYRADDIDAVRTAVSDAFLAQARSDAYRRDRSVVVSYRVDSAALAGGATGPPALAVSVERA